MKYILRFASAASLLLAAGIAITWFAIGSSSSAMSLSKVAGALDAVKSATFALKMEAKDPLQGKPISMDGKGMFLAPGRQRMEMTLGPQQPGMVMIMDAEAKKCLSLMPQQKIAVVIDTEKILQQVQKAGGAQPDMFEMIRRLVREGSSTTGQKVKALGTKAVDGRSAAGFLLPSNMGDMTIWADPQTALPIRIEIAGTTMDSHMVMDDFHYDVALASSLFSVEPPADYTVQKIDVGMPTEADLVTTLRTIAEHHDGMFPAAVGMNKEFIEAVGEILKPEMEKLAAKYGKESPELLKEVMPLQQKYQQGVMFYMMLQPANDSHYTGGGVKLGTPDRPIFWYKPTGSEKYHVLYADLHFAELDAAAVAKFPQAAGK